MMPKDPVMLLSYINTELRDYYENLEDFCDDKGVSQTEIKAKMEMIDYFYDTKRNQFV